MKSWAPVMSHDDGGLVGRYWNDTTKAQFEANPKMIFPYPYMGMDFQGDPDIGLPFGYVWGPAVM